MRAPPKGHLYGTGGAAGPYHGRRLAHCADADVPPKLRARRRNGAFLQYEIIEVARPRKIKRLLMPHGVEALGVMAR